MEFVKETFKNDEYVIIYSAAIYQYINWYIKGLLRDWQVIYCDEWQKMGLPHYSSNINFLIYNAWPCT